MQRKLHLLAQQISAKATRLKALSLFAIENEINSFRVETLQTQRLPRREFVPCEYSRTTP